MSNPSDHASWRMRGFLAVELIISVMFLSVAIVWAMQVSVIGPKLAENAYRELIAEKGVLEYELEYFRSVASISGAGYNLIAPVSEQACPGPPFPFTLSVVPRDLAPGSGDMLNQGGLPGVQCHYWVDEVSSVKRITVRVSWMPAAGHQQRTLFGTIHIVKPTS